MAVKTRLFVNAGLLALFIALAWFAFKGDTPPPLPPDLALTSLSADGIDSIQIERAGNTVATLQRRADVWYVETPVAATADAFRVQALLGLARARSSTGFRAAGNDLTQYGLQPPRATVRFDATVLLIGDTDPVAGHRYVMSGDQVHLLEDNWFSQIFGNGIAWLDPRPLPTGVTLARIDLRGATGDDPRNSQDSAVQWQRLDGHWQRTPADSTASAQSTGERGAALADAWHKARALSVRRRDPKLGWDRQVLVAFNSPLQSATGGAVETITFSVARTDDALFLERADLGVQYRFLIRQGNALLDMTTPE
jgi:hypothetical protein